jgi:glycolate oxidase
LAKKDFLHLKTGEAGLELMQRLKAAFDPNGILNPGKIVNFTNRRRLVVQR